MIEIMKTLGFTKTQANILLFLDKQEEKIDIETMQTEFKIDRTTAQKAIYDLMNRGIVNRCQINQSRGFKFFYWCNINIKKLILKKLKENYETKLSEVKKYYDRE